MKQGNNFESIEPTPKEIAQSLVEDFATHKEKAKAIIEEHSPPKGSDESDRDAYDSHAELEIEDSEDNFLDYWREVPDELKSSVLAHLKAMGQEEMIQLITRFIPPKQGN